MHPFLTPVLTIILNLTLALVLTLVLTLTLTLNSTLALALSQSTAILEAKCHPSERNVFAGTITTLKHHSHTYVF